MKIILGYIMALALSMPAWGVSYPLRGETPQTSGFIGITTLYDPDFGTLDLFVAITNNSAPEYNFTAWALTAPYGVDGVLEHNLVSGWQGVFGVVATDYGFFNLGAISGNTFNAGDVPNGIYPGETGEFNLRMFGIPAILAQLTPADFMTGSFNVRDNTAPLLVRAETVSGQSDNLVPGSSIPEPSTLLLLSIGMVLVRLGRAQRS
ncbi:MAG: PEP-CTERM sorting domain-containing protein [Candidatus Falkowbacteria bacterium]